MNAEAMVVPVAASVLRTWLEQAMASWGLRALADDVDIRVSRRMTRSLGNARPAEKRVTLAAWLMSRPPQLIREVLCHEAAHIAVFAMYGRHCKPHGSEWRGLMRDAGYQPRVRIDVPGAPRPRRRRRRRASGLQRIAGVVRLWVRA